MKKFEVEWALHARGVEVVHADSREKTELIVDLTDWEELIGNAARADWTSTATEVAK